MAIDYIINYNCVPKEKFNPLGILERIKGEQRARMIIGLFRKNGDDRPPSQMGFEFTRSTPDGTEENRVVVVQDLLDNAAELTPFEHHCQGCPANIMKKPFGCMNFIQYPISSAAESWMIDRLPVPDEPLTWLLLRQGVKEFDYDGSTVQPLRQEGETYFEERLAVSRRLGEFSIDSNQVFEMMFGVGSVLPNHAALLLLFMKAIDRDLEANDIMTISPAPPDAAARYPFLLQPEPTDDQSISEIKAFLHALYIAWTLDVTVMLDV